MRKVIASSCSFILAILIVASIFSLPASASILESDYINSYTTGLNQGTSNGQLKLNYTLVGTGTMDKIGISKIVVYKSDGTWYRTIYGTVSNGLLEQNTFVAFGTYRFTVAAGVSYYCKVTYYAEKNGGYDTRTVQTRTVTAPTIP